MEKGRNPIIRRTSRSPSNDHDHESEQQQEQQQQEQPLMLEKGFRIDVNGQREGEAVKLLGWNEIESWQQDNEYILSGYRPASASLRKSLQSLGHLHNETVNVYSHIFGAILFMILPVYIYTSVIPRWMQADLGDIVVFTTFFSGVTICFVLSALFHTVANHSEMVAAFGNQLDHLGIVILMWGSTLPTIYYGFYCNKMLQCCYWCIITILSILSAIATMNPRFRNPALRPYRAAMYALLGLSALVFIFHSIALYGWELQNQRMSLQWMCLMTGLNFVGAGAYAARVPERWFPHAHDFLGSSHQIMHFMVIFAGLAHLVGLLKAFDFVHAYPAC